jgi:2-methylcitrate dehydratase PrpD
MNNDTTRAVAAFAAAEHHFPPLARARAVDAITDCVGCMLAGSREALAAPLLKTLATVATPRKGMRAPLLGTHEYAAPGDAALFNGTVAHALDYDDTNHPAYAHPSAVLVPALLALAASEPVTGRALVDAYIVGFELFGKLGRALNTAHYKRGWHATGTFGAIAAAVAAGNLLCLNERRMVNALGIAASSAAGLRANFGSMVKPLHAGQAARNGVVAALLAREGFVATDAVFEHEYGYCEVFNDGLGFDPAPLAAAGESLEILTQFGLALKLYPSCGATHPGIEAALMLRPKIGDVPIRSVRAGVCEMALAPLIHVMPKAPLEGKFSLHYCIAAALVDGAVNLDTFTPAKIADRRIRELIPRITMQVDERVRHGTEFPTIVEVETESGRRLECLVPLAPGKPERWFTPEQLHAKFDDCALRAWSPGRLDEAFAALRALDDDVPVATRLVPFGFQPAGASVLPEAPQEPFDAQSHP